MRPGKPAQQSALAQKPPLARSARFCRRKRLLGSGDIKRARHPRPFAIGSSRVRARLRLLPARPARARAGARRAQNIVKRARIAHLQCGGTPALGASPIAPRPGANEVRVASPDHQNTTAARRGEYLLRPTCAVHLWRAGTISWAYLVATQRWCGISPSSMRRLQDVRKQSGERSELEKSTDEIMRTKSERLLYCRTEAKS